MTEESDDVIFGRHPVLERLRDDKGGVNKLWIVRGAAGIDGILKEARARGVVFQWVDRPRLEKMTGAVNHQGVAARVSPYDYAELGDLFKEPRPRLVLALDGITDPHNLGAILRNAAFFGAGAVVVPRWRSAGLTGTVAKAAAGALGKVPLVQTANIAGALRTLKEKGYWVYGADKNGKPSETLDYAAPTVLVIGSEDEGLHRLVRETCDETVAVSGTGLVESLNASCAAAVLLFDFARRKKARA